MINYLNLFFKTNIMDLKKVSVSVSLIGLILLYLIFLNSEIPRIEPGNIDETHIGKTLQSKVRVSSVKYYNESFTIYPKEYKFKITGFEKLEIALEENQLIEFTGKVDEDKYGLVIMVDELKIY
ncbi:hypothetical protein C0585_04845 [Candidatus Woesearchaeota archaeon]|nr:MAG: hypothetical protein C0585_04845 [Candidatus Woesearchaeota archaeon]